MSNEERYKIKAEALEEAAEQIDNLLLGNNRAQVELRKRAAEYRRRSRPEPGLPGLRTLTESRLLGYPAWAVIAAVAVGGYLVFGRRG